MGKIKKAINIIYIVFFLSVLILPVIFMETKTNVESEIDNRMFNEAPEIGDPDYFNNFKLYFNDRIGFRNSMIKTYGILNDVFFGELTHPLYTRGEDDYVFFKMHNKIKYNDFHKTFAEMALKLQHY